MWRQSSSSNKKPKSLTIWSMSSPGCRRTSSCITSSLLSLKSWSLLKIPPYPTESKAIIYQLINNLPKNSLEWELGVDVALVSLEIIESFRLKLLTNTLNLHFLSKSPLRTTQALKPKLDSAQSTNCSPLPSLLITIYLQLDVEMFWLWLSISRSNLWLGIITKRWLAGRFAIWTIVKRYTPMCSYLMLPDRPQQRSDSDPVNIIIYTFAYYSRVQ